MAVKSLTQIASVVAIAGIGLVLPIENAIHKDDKHLVKYVVQGAPPA